MAPMIFISDGNDTGLSRLNPITKLICLLSLSIICLSGPDEAVISCFIIIPIIAYSSRIQLFRRLWEARAMLCMALFIMMTGCIFEKDIAESILKTLTFMIILSGAIIFTASTDPMETSAAIGSALSHIAGKRGWAMAADMMLTISILPSIFQITEEMLSARRSRGGRFSKHPIRYVTEYTISVMSLLIDRMTAFSDALDCRSYKRETTRNAPSYSCADMLLIIISIAIAVIAIWIGQS